MRFVLDTNVLVAAMRSPRGASAALSVAPSFGIEVLTRGRFVVECGHLPERAAREIEFAAREAGQTPTPRLSERALADAKAFIADRAKGADKEAFDRILSREGGEPPRPGDEID